MKHLYKLFMIIITRRLFFSATETIHLCEKLEMLYNNSGIIFFWRDHKYGRNFMKKKKLRKLFTKILFLIIEVNARELVTSSQFSFRRSVSLSSWRSNAFYDLSIQLSSASFLMFNFFSGIILFSSLHCCGLKVSSEMFPFLFM